MADTKSLNSLDPQALAAFLSTMNTQPGATQSAGPTYMDAQADRIRRDALLDKYLSDVGNTREMQDELNRIVASNEHKNNLLSHASTHRDSTGVISPIIGTELEVPWSSQEQAQMNTAAFQGGKIIDSVKNAIQTVGESKTIGGENFDNMSPVDLILNGLDIGIDADNEKRPDVLRTKLEGESLEAAAKVTADATKEAGRTDTSGRDVTTEQWRVDPSDPSGRSWVRVTTKDSVGSEQSQTMTVRVSAEKSAQLQNSPNLQNAVEQAAQALGLPSRAGTTLQEEQDGTLRLYGPPRPDGKEPPYIVISPKKTAQ